jgi:hypothetical protein
MPSHPVHDQKIGQTKGNNACFLTRSHLQYHNPLGRPVTWIIIDALAHLWTFRGCSGKEKQHALSVSQSGMRQTRHRRTSQSFTPFIISCSRANAACSRRYASLSPSANSSGTRCMRDQIFSLCSSLKKYHHLNQSSFPILGSTSRYGPILCTIRYLLRHAAGSIERHVPRWARHIT